MNKTINAALVGDSGLSRSGNPAKLIEDLGPLFAGGFLLGSVAVVFSAMVNWVAIVCFHQYVEPDPHNWPQAIVAVFCVFAVLVSLVIGRWLFRLRNNIGHDGDPTAAEMIRSKRRSFALGSMLPYAVFTPLVWLMVLAFTYSSAAM